ncbi:hypothetical protein [Flavobacterium sp. W21_SRS_FM6]|uniref:hypothetical protein n=1 Tax=Flavobacterium sp. W21_SRS_FM6 TaxID=3240268 RepID=UPI003F8DE846
MITPWPGALALSFGAWGLVECFVRQCRMALPAIGLLLAFLGGMFALPILYFDFIGQRVSEFSLVLSGILTAIAARLHWLCFKVPLTVAVGTAAAVVCVLAIIVTAVPTAVSYIMPLVFLGDFCHCNVVGCR